MLAEQSTQEHPIPLSPRECEDIDALATQLPGNGFMEPDPRHLSPGSPQPITVEAYFARHLRQRHPDAADEAIERAVRRAMEVPDLHDHLTGLLETELEIREKNPGWTGGWLGEGESA